MALQLHAVSVRRHNLDIFLGSDWFPCSAFTSSKNIRRRQEDGGAPGAGPAPVWGVRIGPAPCPEADQSAAASVSLWD
ncbi:hypothetical protein AMECASPLE_002021 [Ameca splendens]|uniref:Uncharacterized protein n=1 Tax=Ameca splendens TaxID=208324 RepID=A0ABV1A4G2_9TELE